MTKPVDPAIDLHLHLGSEDTDGARGRQTRGTERGETGTANTTATATATAIDADLGMRTETPGRGIPTTTTRERTAEVGKIPTTDPRDRGPFWIGRRRGPSPATDKVWSNAPAHCLLKGILSLSAREKNPRSQKRSPTSAPRARWPPPPTRSHRPMGRP